MDQSPPRRAFQFHIEILYYKAPSPAEPCTCHHDTAKPSSQARQLRAARALTVWSQAALVFARWGTSKAIRNEPPSLNIRPDFPRCRAEYFARQNCKGPPGDFSPMHWQKALDGELIFTDEWAPEAVAIQSDRRMISFRHRNSASSASRETSRRRPIFTDRSRPSLMISYSKDRKDRSHELRLSGSISTATVTSLPTNAHLCWAIFTIERRAKPPFVVWARLNDAQV